MQRHVIMTLGRSGSNTLVNLLNQNPSVLNVGEVLGPWNRVSQIRRLLNLYPNNTAAYLDSITNETTLLKTMVFGRSLGRIARLKPSEIKRLRDVKTVGFKEFVTLMAQKDQDNWLRERPEVKVIGLIRDDLLGRFVSWQLLNKTGIVLQSRDQREEPGLIYVNPKNIKALLDIVENENMQLRNLLSSLDSDRCFTIYYEQFYKSENHRKEIINDVFLFLGVPIVSTSLYMKKIIKTPPALMIKNREECAEALINTKYEGLLDVN